MCFIKNSCLGSPALLGNDHFLPDLISSFPAPKDQGQSCSSIDLCPSFSSIPHFLTSQSQLLQSLLNAVHFNSNLLLKLQQDLDFSQEMVEQASKETEMSLRKDQGNKHSFEGRSWTAKEQVVQKLFGEKQYKYRLKLRNKFPSTIYKERNIGLNIELIDGQDKLVMNSNLINICVAACETTGNWIAENQEGEYFIQGKTEVQLYHGEAIFHKIYPRDVSRQYQNGKIDVVIYPKPSLIQFSTSASNVQEHVRAQQIEPLLLKDITIRAKKKTQ